MAERFGGKHSPGPASANVGDNAALRRDERRTFWLFLVATPFAVKAFWQDANGLALHLATFGVLTLAAWLTREGIRAAHAFAARKVARRPALPRKLVATALTGGGLFLGAVATGQSLWASVLMGLAGGTLHFLSFGPDPMRDKGMDQIDPFQQDRVARVLVEGEAHLKAMKAAADRTGDRQIVSRVDKFLVEARALFRTVEEDPRDLTAARRYLGVYLMGAKDATIKFADIWAQNRNPEARADFDTLLTDLETTFAAKTALLMSDDKKDLDVEIGVLRDRLKREGLTHDR